MTNYVCPCDTCGKPVLERDMVYSIANKLDDDGNRISARHWACHTPIGDRFEQLRREIDKTTLQAQDLGVRVGHPPRRPR